MGIFDLIFNTKKAPKQKAAPQNTKKETLDGISVIYKKHPFSKCIRITPKQDGTVLVTLPKRTSYACAKEFVQKNAEWIKNSLKKTKNDWVFDKTSPDYSRIIEERRKLAKKILPKRLDELAKKFGFKYGKVFVKNQKTVWGSCSFRNNINLNLNLVTLDDTLIDYVLLHELTHTVHKNHQREFYNLLVKNMPNALEIRKRLKKVRIDTTRDGRQIK